MSREPLSTTGIGSLPHTDSKLAYEFVRRTCDVPYLAQLPRTGRFGEMLFEPFESAPELIETAGRGGIRKGASEEAVEWSRRPGVPRTVVTAFCDAVPPECAPRIKGQLAGPFTMLTQLPHAGIPLISQEPGRELVRNVLSRQVDVEIPLLRRGREELIYILDEPVLGFLRKKEVLQARDLARDLFSRIRMAGARPGIHCCSALPGKAAASVLESLDVDVLSLDFSSLGPIEQIVEPAFLRAFFEKGGLVIWGVVPTLGSANTEAIGLWWKSEVEKLDVPAAELRTQSILSPACGLGLLNEVKAEAIFASLAEVQKLV